MMARRPQRIQDYFNVDQEMKDRSWLGFWRDVVGSKVEKAAERRGVSNPSNAQRNGPSQKQQRKIPAGMNLHKLLDSYLATIGYCISFIDRYE